MSKNLEEKQKKVKEFAESLKGVQTLVVTEYKGLNVAEVTELRRKLRQNKVNYCVVKNTLAKLSFDALGYKDLNPFLQNPVALAYTSTDPVSCAKVLVDFRKEHESLKLKAGWLNQKMMNLKEIEALAKLPSREVLLAKLACSLQGPLAGLARVLNGPPTKLVQVLDAIAKKKK